jgi:hypothetical protein
MTSAPQAYVDTIRSAGGPDVSPSQLVTVWHIEPTPVVLEHFIRRPVSPDDTERFHRRFDAVVATVQPYPGVVEMLEALDRGGYRLGVFTTATRQAATSMLAAAGLAGYFPVVCQPGSRPLAPSPELPTTRNRRDRRRLHRRRRGGPPMRRRRERIRHPCRLRLPERQRSKGRTHRPATTRCHRRRQAAAT